MPWNLVNIILRKWEVQIWWWSVWEIFIKLNQMYLHVRMCVRACVYPWFHEMNTCFLRALCFNIIGINYIPMIIQSKNIFHSMVSTLVVACVHEYVMFWVCKVGGTWPIRKWQETNFWQILANRLSDESDTQWLCTQY